MSLPVAQAQWGLSTLGFSFPDSKMEKEYRAESFRANRLVTQMTFVVIVLIFYHSEYHYYPVARRLFFSSSSRDSDTAPDEKKGNMFVVPAFRSAALIAALQIVMTHFGLLNTTLVIATVQPLVYALIFTHYAITCEPSSRSLVLASADGDVSVRAVDLASDVPVFCQIQTALIKGLVVFPSIVNVTGFLVGVPHLVLLVTRLFFAASTSLLMLRNGFSPGMAFAQIAFRAIELLALTETEWSQRRFFYQSHVMRGIRVALESQINENRLKENEALSREEVGFFFPCSSPKQKN